MFELISLIQFFTFQCDIYETPEENKIGISLFIASQIKANQTNIPYIKMKCFWQSCNFFLNATLLKCTTPITVIATAKYQRIPVDSSPACLHITSPDLLLIT